MTGITKEPMISVVIPLHNETGNLRQLFARVNKTLLEYGKDFEIIFVNDGSTDESEQILRELQNDNQNIVIINFFKRIGKAVALERGFDIAKGKYVATIDSDLQHDPEDIPKLIKKMDEGFDIVSGKRSAREDPKLKIVTSKIFNATLRLITGLKFDDYFSGIKCFRRDVIDYLALYGDLYRLAAVFAFRDGFKVIEIDVGHHVRLHGKTKYSPIMRLQRAFMDLFTVTFTIIFSRKRIYYIGIIGLFIISFGLISWMIGFTIFGYVKTAMESYIGITGSIMIFLGIQMVILKNIADNFFNRHQEERTYWKRNIKNILYPKDA